MITGHAELTRFLDEVKASGKRVLAYAGFDPTGDGLHIGHLGVLSLLSRFQEAGHKTVAIIGTGTSMVGDPTGKNAMRPTMTPETIEKNAEGIQKDISRVFSHGGQPIEFVRNDWLKDLNLMSFLRDFGSMVPMSTVCNLHIVKSRMESGDGITLMEAIYPVLQGVDMVFMAKRAIEQDCDIIVQCGGIDQTGNIAMGMHLVNRMDGKKIETEGVLCELIVSANGEKMGKSAGNAVWLSPEKTDDLQFFDNIVSMPDDMVPSAINVLMPSLDKDGNIMTVKKAMAIGLTGWVRGERAVENILNIKSKGFDAGELKTVEMSLNQPHSGKISLLHVLTDAGLAPSLSEGRRLIKNKGVKIDGQTVEMMIEWQEPSEFVVSKGKKSHVKVRITE